MDVYGLGTLAMDVLIQVDTLPGEDSFCIVKSSERQPGGSGTNVIVQLADLSVQSAMMTSERTCWKVLQKSRWTIRVWL